MKKQIINVSVLQTAKVSAVMYLVISLPFVVMMLLSGMAGGAGPSMFFIVLAPIVYMIFGFIFTAISAWLYNLVASRVGGIEFTTAEVNK